MADTHAPQHPPAHETPAARTPTSVASNILAIVGFLILIVIVLWGLFHIATLSSGWFSSLLPNGGNAIELSLPQSAHSGEPVRLGWKYSTTATGHFAFLYDCADGIEFAIPIVKQGETQAQLAPVTCGQAFTLGNATSSVIIVPFLATSSTRTAHLSMLFTPESGATVRGSGQLTIEPGAAQPATSTKPAATKPTSKPTTTAKPATTAAPVASGPADLAVSILSVSTDGTGLSTVSFDIRNDGARPTGTYTFSAYLPTSQPYTFYSDPQVSLAPGAHIVNTLHFSQSVSGTFTVVVDPSNTVREANESNNTTSAQISAPYIPYDAYNNAYAPNGYPTYYTY
jgi:hypothetical protein